MDGLTVLMSVRNGAEYLQEALDSLYAQSFGRFELLVIDNGSRDATPDILAAQRDERLRVLRQDPELSLAGALNRGLEAARYPWIARMDADDVCRPLRLEKQVEFLQRHPEVKLLGTGYRIFGPGQDGRWVVRPLTHPLDIAWHYTWENCLGHPTVMFPRELVRYPEARAQDYAAFAPLSQRVRAANLPEVLLDYRWHGQNMSIVEKDSGELHALQKANLEGLVDEPQREAYLRWHLQRQGGVAMLRLNLIVLERLSRRLGFGFWPLHRPRLALTLLNRLRQGMAQARRTAPR